MQPAKSQTDELCRNRFRVVDTPLTSNLAIRSGPSISSSVLGLTTNGQTVIFNASDRSGDWADILTQGDMGGWVKMNILRDMEGLPREFNGFLRIMTLDGDPVRLRARAGLGKAVIDNLRPDTKVKFVSRDGDWIQVRTTLGKQGYILSMYLICD